MNINDIANKVQEIESQIKVLFEGSTGVLNEDIQKLNSEKVKLQEQCTHPISNHSKHGIYCQVCHKILSQSEDN